MHELYEIFEQKVILRISHRVCDTADELLASDLFREVVTLAVRKLEQRRSILLDVFGKKNISEEDIAVLIETLQFLSKMPGEMVPKVVSGADILLKNPFLLNDLVEFLYNFWRSYDRYVLCDSSEDDMDKRPYRTFNNTIEHLTHLIRKTYRDIEENITGSHPRTYRQLRAGAEIAAISMPMDIPLPGGSYRKLKQIPVIRQVLLYPPLILDPPMNKRTGRFEKVAVNPLDIVTPDPADWLCYPARVGPLVILVYFHKKFFELGFSLCNLFDMADDNDLQKPPDAVYLFGTPEADPSGTGCFPTVFFDDRENSILSAAAPNADQFGYFGYLKKMVLTLHNIRMMKRGSLPFHGAMVRIIMKGDRARNILIIGDTGAGKSETLEAFRELGEEMIQDMIVISDDMGSLEIHDGHVIGYGTEIGAFLRLDDLAPGYALGQIDRAIIMNPNKINARIILPVTTMEHVLKGYEVDIVLYANNYEEIDEDHMVVERFQDPRQAIEVFRQGMVMSKGTTTSKGIVHSYFANVFGPPQYKDLHEPLALRYFEALFASGAFVGQMRTRLGIPGWERSGPEEAARALLGMMTTP